MDNYNNFYNGQPQNDNYGNYQPQNSQYYQDAYQQQPVNYQAVTQDPANLNQVTTQQTVAQQFPHPQMNLQNFQESAGKQENQDDSILFGDPNSFVPQTLRQYNTRGRYFTTRGRDKFGQEVKFYFTQEERDYLTKYGISAQQFYDKYQSKLGGEFVKGDPTRSPTFVGPSFQDPASFIPGDMRSNCPDNYFKYMIQGENGTMQGAFLTKEEIDFTRNANIDISTYVNVYQSEFNYDKGQMEKSANQSATQSVSQVEQDATQTPNNYN